MALERTPPYLQVVQELRQRIVSGELKDGDRLPSVRQIAETYAIAQATAMKVLAALRADGLAESVVGVGTVVTTRRSLHRTALDRLERAIREDKIYPDDEKADIISAALAPAPRWVADLFGIEEGEDAIRRHRVTSNPDGPVSASVSWFAADLAESVPVLLRRERILNGSPKAVAAATGRTLSPGGSEASTVGRANADQARELGVENGAPIYISRNVYYDIEGGIIEVGESIAPEGRWKIHRSA
ncbi:GntR family transcriptional regulator (plasmid) [Kitasatospora purpeofusca]|uniref:GntR family transcriptional regulator n=1 Tax=Kitasatospora purpeofusca TaxID=67352 RepID=UPI002E109EC7|nr:GntR family transcriptional regulator [Kitasatospora purpeofusca]